MSLRDNFRDFMHGVAYGQYEREMRRQAAELNDLFLLLCYMEIVGLPNPATLYPTHLKSVRTRVLTLPDHFLLFPGHGPSTTVREEKDHNPFG